MKNIRRKWVVGNGMEEIMNVKILELTIENKELKRGLVEWTTLQKECQELTKKEEARNET